MTTTQNAKPTASAKRYAAISRVCDQTRLYDPSVNQTVWTTTHAEREGLAAVIRTLAPLGRTERWTSAVEDWAVKVETSTDETFQWAFDQFGVWAAYAAE